jgi:hypothetical protein
MSFYKNLVKLETFYRDCEHWKDRQLCMKDCTNLFHSICMHKPLQLWDYTSVFKEIWVLIVDGHIFFWYSLTYAGSIYSVTQLAITFLLAPKTIVSRGTQFVALRSETANACWRRSDSMLVKYSRVRLILKYGTFIYG